MTHTQGATATRKSMSGPLVLASLATLACALCGSAIPVIRFGYKQLEIASGDTGSQLLFAGIRFFLAGLAVTLAHAAASPMPGACPTAGSFRRPCSCRSSRPSDSTCSTTSATRTPRA